MAISAGHVHMIKSFSMAVVPFLQVQQLPFKDHSVENYCLPFLRKILLFVSSTSLNSLISFHLGRMHVEKKQY